MTDDIKKIVIISSCLVILIGLIVLAVLVDVDLKIIKFNSIESLIGKHDELKATEEQLKAKEVEYNNTIKKVEDMQTTFDSEKTKYEAISDETINIIKEATTEENYNIEYMWIRLGNYAKSNNLTIVMAEPGGTFESTETSDKDGSKSKDSKTSTASATTDKTSTTNTNTTSSGTTNSNGNATTSSTESSSTEKATETTTSNTLFKIQVTGSYLDVSDFIFEVENDKALRFRLDNISMDYVSGTTIKASFNVKNLIINK